MREIKFRFWSKKENKMFIDCYDENFVYYLDGNDENVIPMQYTGVKDKDGKRIYEGDIVLGDKLHYRSKVIGVVKYGGLAFSYIGKTENGDEWFDTITNQNYKEDKGIEIIGNIYENKNLLDNTDTKALKFKTKK